jgi:hypothetical protein
LVHASQADAGLKFGKLGSGKKLTPGDVRQYKKLWEKRIDLMLQHRKEAIPLSVRKQLNVLFRFEIRRATNIALSLPDSSPRVQEIFEYFDQLVLEELISGVDIRSVLLDAYSDMAKQSIDRVAFAKRLPKSIWGLLLNLVGPELVPIGRKEKVIFLKSLGILETIGEFAAEYDGGKPVLISLGEVLCDFAEIGGMYNLRKERPRFYRIFQRLDRACTEYRPPRGTPKLDDNSEARRAVVHKYWKKAKQLYQETTPLTKQRKLQTEVDDNARTK